MLFSTLPRPPFAFRSLFRVPALFVLACGAMRALRDVRVTVDAARPSSCASFVFLFPSAPCVLLVCCPYFHHCLVQIGTLMRCMRDVFLGVFAGTVRLLSGCGSVSACACGFWLCG
ncbi:hypothetical protein TRVL_04715 [Trypanosoma vivax]|nr:hypothetical protein TRVL_04715 [Trypanosoma vivax]